MSLTNTKSQLLAEYRAENERLRQELEFARERIDDLLDDPDAGRGNSNERQMRM